MKWLSIEFNSEQVDLGLPEEILDCIFSLYPPRSMLKWKSAIYKETCQDYEVLYICPRLIALTNLKVNNLEGLKTTLVSPKDIISPRLVFGINILNINQRT